MVHSHTHTFSSRVPPQIYITTLHKKSTPRRALNRWKIQQFPTKVYNYSHFSKLLKLCGGETAVIIYHNNSRTKRYAVFVLSLCVYRGLSLILLYLVLRSWKWVQIAKLSQFCSRKLSWLRSRLKKSVRRCPQKKIHSAVDIVINQFSGSGSAGFGKKSLKVHLYFK